MQSNISIYRYVIYASAIAALAGLLSGLDMGVVSGALPLVAKTFFLSDRQQELIVSLMPIGAGIGAICASWIASAFGRRFALALSALMFAIGTLAFATGWTTEALLVARLIIGLSIGVASFTAPLYLSEIAPKAIRGALVSCYQLMLTVGILIGFICDLYFSFHGGWRWMFGALLFPAAVLFFGVLTLPDSPRWLLMRGKRDQAVALFKKLGNDAAEIQDELADSHKPEHQQQNGWKLLKTSKHFRRALTLGAGLMVLQQFTGMTVIMYYAPRILQLAGFVSHQSQIMGTVILGLVNVLATIFSIKYVDRWGRKPILYLGCTFMALAAGAMSILFQIGMTSEITQIIAVAVLVTFIIAFAISAGPLVWVLCPEILPAAGRSFGVSVSTLVIWASSMTVTGTFLTLIDLLGQSTTFAMYALFNVVFLCVTIFFIPETRNRSLEQLERNLFKGLPLRHLGNLGELEHNAAPMTKTQ